MSSYQIILPSVMPKKKLQNQSKKDDLWSPPHRLYEQKMTKEYALLPRLLSLFLSLAKGVTGRRVPG